MEKAVLETPEALWNPGSATDCSVILLNNLRTFDSKLNLPVSSVQLFYFS